MEFHLSRRATAEGFRDLTICFRDVFSDDNREWLSLPNLEVDHGLEDLLPTFTKLEEDLEAFRSAIDAAALQEACNLAQGMAKHILACLRARSVDLPMEALREADRQGRRDGACYYSRPSF